MYYHSTRDRKSRVAAQRAIADGIAPDGGLYVPESLPHITPEEIDSLRAMSYPERAAEIMCKFLDDFSKEELLSYARSAYGEQFDSESAAPVFRLDRKTSLLELWHGPTCAFKDLALQIMPYLLTASLEKLGERREVCILVATSGDTGKAALEGFRDIPGTRIAVFYPRDGVSRVQELQMTTQEGGNVFVCSVEGNFDDAQNGVKRIFGDTEFSSELAGKGFLLSSANSINWGRLLPQIAYYVSAYCDLLNRGSIDRGERINFCVPTGNFGNILAGWYAREMGLPISRLICASNENRVLTDFIETGIYNRNRKFFTTISPSMDILVSSNLERLLFALSGDPGQISILMSELTRRGEYSVSPQMRMALTGVFSAGCCSDLGTKAEIYRVRDRLGYLLDPHTAVGSAVLNEYRERTGDPGHTVLISTASPFKFAGSVLEALGMNPGGSSAEQLGRLAAATGIAPPAPLIGIDGREVRFKCSVRPGNMTTAVREFLS